MFQLLQFLTFVLVLIGLNGILLVTSENCSANFNVNYPFRLNSGDRVNNFGNSNTDDGYPGLVLKCLNSRLVINISNHYYVVLGIDYAQKDFDIVDLDIVEKPDCPQPRKNYSSTLYFFTGALSTATIFYNCTNNTQNVNQSLPCLDKDNNNTKLRSYGFSSDTRNLIPEGFNGYSTCAESVEVPYSYTFFPNYTDINLAEELKKGFKVGFSFRECENCHKTGGRCQFTTTDNFLGCHCQNGRLFEHGICSSSTTERNFIIGVPTAVGGVVLLILLVIYRKIIFSLCSCWKSKTESSTNVEVFLDNYGCLGLQRYKYSEVKEMTNSFKYTLGKGGYGCVFKGQLRDGRLVAVKVLNESKGNGEDFVNEVSTIGRTNHVNVVSLLGFCTEKTKRALVYEFMPNGSLERFIYKEKESSFTPPLGSEKLYQIALGIARGLEYLHRGCNTRILHFDIKPHNILLDEDFCPKISDFGLAKLCPTRDVSVMSMTGARGTIGYIAPEFCFRNFGGVSHKSDVYSYGMMVFEMIGERKNINTKVENMSEIYFPQWVYNHLKPDFNIEGPLCEVFKEETIKKMIVVALWCIQTHPTDRPSMTKVVEMLEGNNAELEMPPNPFLHPTIHSSTSSS